MITVQTFGSRINQLKNRDLSEPEFYDKLATLMALSCCADQHWLLLIGDDDIEVLSDNDEDLRQFKQVSASDEDFYKTLDWALEDKEVRMLTLEAVGNPLPADRFAKTQSIGGDLFFVPVASPFEEDILICLHCHDIDADSATMHQWMEQLTILSALGELRVSAAISKSIKKTAELRQQEDRKKINSLQEALELGTAASVSLEKEKSQGLF